MHAAVRRPEQCGVTSSRHHVVTPNRPSKPYSLSPHLRAVAAVADAVCLVVMRTTNPFQPVMTDARVHRSLVSPSVLVALEISDRQAPRVDIATMAVIQFSASAYHRDCYYNTIIARFLPYYCNNSNDST